METDFYTTVPKDYTANLKWREHWNRRASNNPALQQQLWVACKRDMLYFVNSWGFLFEPRSARTHPFITYEFQDETLLKLQHHIGMARRDEPGNWDVVITKSRDMGASWMVATAYAWHFLFVPQSSFLIMSRKESLVDEGYGKNDPKSLFFKVDFLLDRLPKWMRPQMIRNKLNMSNVDNGSVITGESTNEFAGVADRRLSLLADEFSRMPPKEQAMIFKGTRDVSRCRIFLFTPEGTANKAHDIAHDSKFPQIRLHWSRHPLKNIGLYRVTKGKRGEADKIERLDPNFDYTDYQFITDGPYFKDGQYRSAYYDAECARASHPREIASELDIDFTGSSYQFFPSDLILMAMDKTVLQPRHVGELDYDIQSVVPDSFVHTDGGRLRLWCEPPGKHSDRPYVVGVDVAAGTGASNSCIWVLDRKTGEQAAEFTTPYMRPDQLATQAVALCRWFRDSNEKGAYLIWEANGPGRSFGNRVIELGYRNFFYRRTEKSFSKKVSDMPGWQSTPEDKKALLEDFRAAMARGETMVRSGLTIDDCRAYVYHQGTVEHSRAIDNEDPTGARDNHGDRAIAAALASKFRPRIGGTVQKQKETVMPGSLAHRMMEYKKEKAEVASW